MNLLDFLELRFRDVDGLRQVYELPIQRFSSLFKIDADLNDKNVSHN